jgi:hypothetical protein
MRGLLLHFLAQDERHEKRKEHCGQYVSQTLPAPGSGSALSFL